MLLQGPIDCHAHVVPGEFPKNPSATELRWPCMVCGAGEVRTVTFDGKPFRELDRRSWDIARRLETMEEDGLAAQVLSPMPELMSYWFDGPTAEAMADFVNDFIAEMVVAAPARFRGLGMVPLQSPDQAVKGLTTLKEKFGLDGIQVGSNILGAQIGDAKFEPVWAAAQELGISIFVHALHPLATKGLTGMATPLVGFPLDTGQAAASILLSGVLDRYPRLRMGFSHGGGALGSLIGRLNRGWQLTNGFSGVVATAPGDAAKKLFYDSNVYDPAYLHYLATQLAPGQIFLGTDYPYDIMQTDPMGYLRSVFDSDAQRSSVESGAALRFLGLA